MATIAELTAAVDVLEVDAQAVKTRVAAALAALNAEIDRLNAEAGDVGVVIARLNDVALVLRAIAP